MTPFAAAFLVTHRPADPVAGAIASRRAWERAIRRWTARERKANYQREYQPEWNARRITDCPVGRALRVLDGGAT